MTKSASRSFIDVLIHSNTASDQIQLTILHLFCILTVTSLYYSMEYPALVTFFCTPTLILMAFLFLQSDSDSDRFLFSQYIYICIFAIAIEVMPSISTIFLFWVSCALLLIKLFKPIDTPPFGPAFAYCCYYLIENQIHEELSDISIYYMLLGVLLSIRSKSLINHLFFLSSIYFSIISFEFNDEIYLTIFFLAFSIISISRFKRYKLHKNLYSRILIFEEIIFVLFSVNCIGKFFQFSNSPIFLYLSIFYFSLFLILFFIKYLILSEIFFITCLFCIVSYFTFSNSLIYIDYFELNSVFTNLVAIAGFFLAQKLRFDHAQIFCIFYSLYAILFYYFTGYEDGIENFYDLVVSFVILLMQVFLFVIMYEKTYELSSRYYLFGILRKRHFVPILQLRNNMKELIRTLPLLSIMQSTIQFFRKNIGVSFYNSRWGLPELPLVFVFIITLVFISDCFWFLFNNTSLSILLEIPEVEDTSGETVYEQTVRITAFCVSGFLISMCGTIFQRVYLLSLGLFLPTILLAIYFVISVLEEGVPWPITLLGVIVLLAWTKYAIGYFKDRSNEQL